jgi:hypothetical protein
MTSQQHLFGYLRAMGSTHCCCQPSFELLKAANTETNAPIHALQSAFKHVSIICPEKRGKFNALAVDIVVYQHFFNQKSQSLQLVQSFPFLFEVNIPCHAAASALLHLRAYARCLQASRFSDARDVEQREIHALCACSLSCARSSSAALCTLCRSSGRSRIRMSHRDLGALGPAALRSRVSRFSISRRSSVIMCHYSCRCQIPILKFP